MQTVSPDAAIRDRAQAMVQKVSAVGTALALNPGALSRPGGARCFQGRPRDAILRAAHPAGISPGRRGQRRRYPRPHQDAQRRNHQVRAPNSNATCRSRRLKVVVKNRAELDGLPEDFIKTHKPAADGTITLTSDSPDVTPVLKFAKSADLRNRIFLAYNNRAYPQNVKSLADLLKKREELANLLGYKHWSDLNAADKMAVNAPNIAKFIGEIDVGVEARGRP